MSDAVTDHRQATVDHARHAELTDLNAAIEQLEADDPDRIDRQHLTALRSRRRELLRAAAAESEQAPDADTDTEAETEDETDVPAAAKIRELQAAGEFPPNDSRTKTCPECDGHGKTYTGSGVEGDVLRSCWRCGGHGYLVRRLDPDEERREREASEWGAPDAIPYS